jgi:hypothetical protein
MGYLNTKKEQIQGARQPKQNQHRNPEQEQWQEGPTCKKTRAFSGAHSNTSRIQNLKERLFK